LIVARSNPSASNEGIGDNDQFIEVGGGLFQEVFFGGLVGEFFAEIFSDGYGKSFQVSGQANCLFYLVGPE